MEFGSLAKLRTINPHVKLYKILAVGSFGSKSPYIDSIDGLTFRNQLMSIMLVMPTGQHLHEQEKNLTFKRNRPNRLSEQARTTQAPATQTTGPPLQDLITRVEVTPELELFPYI